MDDVRWFAPNRYCTLPVPLLRLGGLRIAIDGDQPARLALAADGQCAMAGFEYSLRHRTPHERTSTRRNGSVPDASGPWIFETAAPSEGHPPAYGAVPSDSSLRGPWLASSKAAHPSVQNWDLLLQGLNYADAPSAESYMPNMVEAWQRTSTFSNLLVNTGGLDLDKESETFKTDLTTIFNK